MNASNRAAIFTVLQKVAKKQFPVVKPPTTRSLLEHVMYACCLQNSQFDQADEAIARIQRSFFDWNEVRVTTAAELADVMGCLNEPMQAANRLKKTLNSVFEAHYSFDIDFLKKENLGKAIEILDKGRGVTPFVISYVAQSALGGHQIAIDEAMIELMYLIGAIDSRESADFRVPGLERAIPKSQGIEFFSTVHQLAVSHFSSPFKPEIRKIILSIEPEAKDRFIKRASPTSRTEPKKTTKRSDAEKLPKSGAGKAEAKSKVTKKRASAEPPTSKRKPGRPKKTVAAAAAKSPTKQLKRKKPR